MSPSNNLMQPLWQTRFQFMSPHHDHSRHDPSLFNISAVLN